MSDFNTNSQNGTVVAQLSIEDKWNNPQENVAFNNNNGMI